MTNLELGAARRSLGRFITFLCIPVFVTLALFFGRTHNWPLWEVLLVAFANVVVLRAFIDYVLRQVLPAPSLFNNDDPAAREEDLVARRRTWFWRYWARMGTFYVVFCALIALTHGASILHEVGYLAPHVLTYMFSHPAILLQGAQVMALFMVNFLIFMGPLLLMNISQIKVFEPGDTNLGAKFDDVRGQAEAKEEIKRVIEIWEEGDRFEALGGKRERGMLFLGAPGVGKTLLAKAIATSFNAPFLFIPGSGFAATFIGIDAVVVRYMARKAKKAARKWGGTCIIFIDEIDAVGRRRQGQGGGGFAGVGGMFGGGMGQMALNQLLVVMDSIDGPPGMKRFFIRKINTTLDALYFFPRSIPVPWGGKWVEQGGVTERKTWGKLKLRLPAAKPRKDQQIYFIGATNIDLEELDPALVRAGRMGRHVYFRNPTKSDRVDVLDLYVKKVAHDPALETPEKLDELARITQGVSPASIEQICSMALVNAQNAGRDKFIFEDFVEALTTLESGTAVGIDYTEAETRAVAIHEAGHAAASHVYAPEQESSRLSIRMRGNSLGHHQSFAKEEKFGSWRSEDFGQLVRGLAAMAAEYVFYGENGRGVSGDLAQSSALARMMAGRVGMAPYFTTFPSDERQESVDKKDVLDKFEFIGRRLLVNSDSVMGAPQVDREKDKLAAQFMGHAFVTAWNFITLNKERVDAIANMLIVEKEIFGDRLTTILDDHKLEKFDHLDIENFVRFTNWPVL